MNNPFENKAIKFATEQELNHLAELARGYGLNVEAIKFEYGLYFRKDGLCITQLFSNYGNPNDLPEITYSDFIASLESDKEDWIIPPSALPIQTSVEQAPDMVNHPPHYTVNGIEVIDVIENYKLNYRLGNVVKYVLRADLKGNRLQDLKKALWYLQREIDKTEKHD
jgi:hypothetical protein